ncbi:membrane dipeptidase [Brevibacterium siliguriense]|uniref:Membrane dipeptidase n=1 Tax=Brevibacterium siliguriense TaxID=1136497 RepID=A0A1H1PMG5_9MICO|nr:dipeptidase [Brevibacterium siliguriense]SDS12300.1 membrane dipeptidase [Brevibacterium siliguriense]
MTTPDTASAASPESAATASAPAVDVFDGHNDLAWYLREERDYSVEGLNDPSISPFTTMDQLAAGHVAAQYWSVYVHSSITGADAIKATWEQIDAVQRFVTAYPERLAFARTAAEVRAARNAGKVASLMGVEGGQQIDESMAVLRSYARAGARYMTLTWSTTHSWADSATDEPVHGGLSDFGREVVAEMNRIGMILDLSHVAPSVMHQSLDQSTLPVLFTHSCAYGLNPHPRNIPDEVLDRVPGNGGVAMMTFVPSFVSNARREWVDAGEQGIAPEVTVSQVADHCDYVRERIGIDHIGLGGDICGVDELPTGLGDAGQYPNLFAELASRGWSPDDLRKLGFDNAMRVLDAHEDAYTAFLGSADDAPSAADVPAASAGNHGVTGSAASAGSDPAASAGVES